MTARRSSIRRQRPDTNSRWFNHDQIIRQSVHMKSYNLGDTIGLLVIRKPVQFQQDHSPRAKALTEDQVAKVLIFGNQDAGLGPRQFRIFGSDVPESVPVTNATS
jgi:hypothetical protein